MAIDKNRLLIELRIRLEEGPSKTVDNKDDWRKRLKALIAYLEAHIIQDGLQ